MKRQTIAVDVDDVLASINEGMRLYVNKRFGTTHTAEDYNVPGEYRRYWEQIWSVDEAEGSRRYGSFITAGETLRLQPVTGALEAIATLKERFELVIITAREGIQVKETRLWLQKHFPDVFKEVHFMKLWREDGLATKTEIAQAAGADYLIDDNIDHCRLAAEAGIHALLFGNYGWNYAESLPEGVKRYNDWPAVLEYFDERSS